MIAPRDGGNESVPPVVVAMGTSAGGIGMLKGLVRDLPADLGAAVLVVMHIAPTRPSQLAAILDRAGPLPVTDAVDGRIIRPGQVHCAPANRHLLAGRSRLRLSTAPRENGSRPAIDPLFRSAARHHAGRVVGVVLSGMLDDGSAGLLAVRQAGGITVVQDPDDASFSDMPRHAIELARPHHVVPADRLAATIVAAVEEASARDMPEAPDSDPEEDMEIEEPPPDRLTDLTCPDCGGVLWSDGEPPVALRCRTGHRYSPESYFERQGSAVEGALWSAVRALSEQAGAAERVAVSLDARGNESAAAIFRRRARDARRQADLLRRDVIGSGTELLIPEDAG
jgi:two-component system, chemotaxis family, protein-glutamate methylesterase/glutaminase